MTSNIRRAFHIGGASWLVLCAIMYWHVELCSYVAQGNPNICPCLGKVEFTLPFGS